jgi:hypothetical protein
MTKARGRAATVDTIRSRELFPNEVLWRIGQRPILGCLTVSRDEIPGGGSRTYLGCSSVLPELLPLTWQAVRRQAPEEP